MPEKIKVRQLNSMQDALEASLEIWEALANLPDKTWKDFVVDDGYMANCPLCDYCDKQDLSLLPNSHRCVICPWQQWYNEQQKFASDRDRIRSSVCGCTFDVYGIWEENKTRANAIAVVDRLQTLLENYMMDKETVV